MTCYISKRDRNLLVDSEATKVLPWLRQLLVDNEEISDAHLKNLDEEKRALVISMSGRLVQEATQEWIREGDEELPDDDLGDARTTCMLCGNTNNRWVFYIRNRLNGKRMNVGSSCIDEFGIISRDGKTTQQLIRERKRLLREAELSKRFPQLASMLYSWNSGLSSYPVIVPYKFEQSYIEIGNELKKNFEGYISKKLNHSALDRIAVLMEGYERLRSEIITHVEIEDAKDHPFVARRKIVNWLERNDQHVAIGWLKIDGEIRWRTAHRICEPSFMKSLVPLLNEKMNVIVTTADSDRRGYVFNVESLNSIKLFVKHSDLIGNYGGFLTGEDDSTPSLGTLVDISSLEKDDRTLMSVVQKINRSLGRASISLLEWFTNFNELYAPDRATKTIYKVNLTDFMNQFKRMVIGIDRTDVASVIDALKHGDRLSLSDYEEILKTRSPIEKGEKRDMSYVFESA